MPITVEQKWQGSRLSGSNFDGSIDSEYYIRGTNDEFVARTNLDSATAATVGSLIKKDVNIDKRLGEEEWLGSVRWGMLERKDTGDSQFSFDTSGGSQRITQALSTIQKVAAAGTAPDFKGAIGVTENSVEGVDITVPVYNFEETHYIDAATVTAAYKNTLFTLTGQVNSLAFKGFSAGEVLFLGASGSARRHDQWEITFKFSASPNVTGLTVGPDISGVNKEGWDYLWVRYQDEEDGAANKLVRVPEAAYVERVYNRGDLNLLGI